MPPSAIIGTDLSPDSLLYCALGVDSLWKAANLGGGAATWSEIYTVAQFEAAAEVTEAQFTRVLCPSSSIIDILAAAKSDGVTNPWHIRSVNAGETFNPNLVDDTALSSRDYTVTHRVSPVVTIPPGGAAQTLLTTHVRKGDSGTTYNPWGVAHDSWTDDETPGGPWLGIYGDATTINEAGGSNLHWNLQAGCNALLSAPDREIVDDWFDDYFGVGIWEVWTTGNAGNCPKEPARVNLKLKYDHSAEGYKAQSQTWGFWNIPEVLTPKAIAVAPTNLNWIYVGLAGKIRASENGGVSWFDFYNLGAYDVLVDPQNPGVVYYWSTGGNLNMLKKESLGVAGIQVSTAMMTEMPLDVPTRIARDPSSGILLALPNGTVLKRRMNGSNSNLKTGLYNARDLHAYTGQKIIFVDAAEVWKSDNIQATTPTITAVTGNWTEYVGGINAHRIVGS